MGNVSSKLPIIQRNVFVFPIKWPLLLNVSFFPAASGFECWFCSATPGRDESCDSTETAATSKISCPKGVQKCLKTVIKEDDGSLGKTLKQMKKRVENQTRVQG